MSYSTCNKCGKTVSDREPVCYDCASPEERMAYYSKRMQQDSMEKAPHRNTGRREVEANIKTLAAQAVQMTLQAPKEIPDYVEKPRDLPPMTQRITRAAIWASMTNAQRQAHRMGVRELKREYELICNKESRLPAAVRNEIKRIVETGHDS